MYQTLDELEKNIQDNQEKPRKGKRRLKWLLVCLGILITLTGVWAGLTKVGFIPNWFDIEILCNDNLKYEALLGRDYDCDSYSCCNKEGTCVYNIHPELMLDKPIIYLYPTVETQVNIKLGAPENLSHTYPKYNLEKGRNVIAQPSGDLEDMDTGRKLYALYWEGKSDNETNFDEGFVVAGKDIIPFLEDKLAILGLNEREAEEFIVYWLPQMEGNKYNLIRFKTIEEQDENMPLNITPTPDTVIRVMMNRKAIDEAIDIPEQKLITPERNGFTVVEWGGSPRN